MEQMKKEVPPRPVNPPEETLPTQPEVLVGKGPEVAVVAPPVAETPKVIELEKARVKQNLKRFGTGAAALGGVVTVPTKAGAAVIGTAEAAAMAGHSGGFWAGVGKTLGGLEVLVGFGFIVRWINDQIRKQVTGTSGGGGGAKKSGGGHDGGGDHH